MNLRSHRSSVDARLTPRGWAAAPSGTSSWTRAGALACSLAICSACAAPTADGGGDGDGDGDGDSAAVDGSGGGAAPDPSSGGAPSGTGSASGDGDGDGDASGGASPGAVTGSAEIKLPFSENFDDGIADGFIADIDDELAPLGSWTIVPEGDGQAYQQGTLTDDPTWAVGGDFHWTDQRFETRFKITGGIEDVYLYVAARLSDFDHYYYLEVRSDRIKLRVRNDGNADITEWDIPAAMVEGEWHTVALGAVGTTLTVEFDGMVAMTVMDTQLSHGGIALGVRDGTVVFDDILVSAE